MSGWIFAVILLVLIIPFVVSTQNRIAANGQVVQPISIQVQSRQEFPLERGYILVVEKTKHLDNTTTDLELIAANGQLLSAQTINNGTLYEPQLDTTYKSDYYNRWLVQIDADLAFGVGQDITCRAYIPKDTQHTMALSCP